MPPRRRKGASDPKPVHRSPQTLAVSLSLKLLCPFAVIDLSDDDTAQPCTESHEPV